MVKEITNIQASLAKLKLFKTLKQEDAGGKFEELKFYQMKVVA